MGKLRHGGALPVPIWSGMGQDQPPPSWGQWGQRHEDAWGTFWGQRGGFRPPHPTINICIFFFYPACTYGGGRVRGGRAPCQHSIKARGDPKMSRDVPGMGTREQGEEPQNIWRCPQHRRCPVQVKFGHRGSPGVAGDVLGVTWGRGRSWGHPGMGTSLRSPGEGDGSCHSFKVSPTVWGIS